MADNLVFQLNGRPVTVADVSSNTTLLDWLRATGRTGTKEGCAEGDCGACSVALLDTDGHGKPTWRAVNACLTLLPMVAGRTVVTVEGMAEGGPHPVQTAMVDHAGSQCGYCTPGFIASMFEGYYRDDLKTQAQVADQLCGNLCRCTGYRPIRDAMEDVLATRAERPRDRFHLPLAAPAETLAESQYSHASERYAQPTTLHALLTAKAERPGAALIAGATEIGVDINKKARHFGDLLSTERVPELRAVTPSTDHWRIGGAATLTAVEEALAGEYPSLDKMFWVFASRQIRNRATMAGNLVTASPIGDLAPVLLSLDASVELASLRGTRVVPLSEFFLGYRKTVLDPDEVMVAIRLPRGPSAPGLQRRVESFKVSKRRELDISIVAAGLVVDLDEGNVVRHVRLAFGGVAATPSRAKKTEDFLHGRVWDEASLTGALEVLRTEFAPIDDVRSGKAFRVRLVGSLVEKFFAGEKSQSVDLPLGYTVHPRWESGDTTRALRHESALGHVTGEARYIDDVAERRSMLELWPVKATIASGKILSLRTDAAKAMPGVHAVLTADDVPGLNDVGAIRHDEPLFPKETVSFYGQPVAIVVADSYAEARRAAAAVEVEYEAHEPVLGIEAAMAAESYHTAGHRIRRGDVDAALAASPHRLHGSIHIGGQEHFYLESHAAWAEVGEAGEVFVSSSTQHPAEVQAIVAHVLGVGRHQVTVESPRMGGGFGGKETQGAFWAAHAALASLKLGRPVRVQLDRDLDMELTGKRHPFFSKYEVGFDAEGVLTALKATVVSDGGWALDLSESICDRALFHIDNGYFIPNVDVFGRVAKTNAVSHTAFRGFGGPQGMVVIEEALDRIARSLGLPPEVVRRRNLYRGTGESNTTHYGQHIDDNRVERVWDAVVASSEFASRKSAVEAFNATSRKVKRGLAITPVKFGISFTASFLNQAGAYLLVYRDGTLQVNHGGTEMGQGLHTKILGIVLRELGLPRDRVRMMKTATDKVPNTSATAASAGADLNGAAVRDACVTLRSRLVPIAASALGCDPGDVVLAEGQFAKRGTDEKLAFEAVVEKAYFQQIPLSATGFYRTPEVHYDKAKGRGKPFHYYAFCAAVTEVEVDGYTGMKKVLRVDIVHDVGDSLNPGVDRGQIEGGFVQGMGWLTGEELKWDAKGRLLSHSASTYQIPAFSDAPEDFRVTLLPDAAQSNTVHGSKAVGEPPLMLALSVREAIRAAVAAFHDSPARVDLGCPATHEAIAAAIDVPVRA